MIANFSMVSDVDNANPTENKWGAYQQNQSGGRYFTFQLLSSLFAGSADKYLPMSAINGLHITLSCENVSGVFFNVDFCLVLQEMLQILAYQ